MKRYCIVGLGNPGKEYEKTRHNFGFEVLDNFLEKISRYKEKPIKFKKSPKFKCEYSKIVFQDKELILVEPITFMNLSGLAVKSILAYFDINKKNLLVIHDDIDLSLEEQQVRLSFDSGSAGHKGVESIIKELGTKEFYRLRLGIRNEKFLSQTKIPTDKFVLGKFLPDETQNKNKMTQKAVGQIISFLEK